MTSPVGDDDLMAWIDGRLSHERRAVVDSFLSEHPEVRRHLVAQAAQARDLSAVFAPVAAEPIPAAMRVAAIQERRRKKPLHHGQSALPSVGREGTYVTSLPVTPRRPVRKAPSNGVRHGCRA